MASHPFAQSGLGRKAVPNLRRSTRIEVAIPVIISGRDASARPFRDEANTETVNLHGARIQTHRDLLVGMHVTIESPRTGSVARAITVRTNESVPGTDLRYVSVQLEKPGNIWGIENPPEDWAIFESADGEAPAADSAQPAKGTPLAASEINAAQAAALEQQATQIVDAAAERLRGLVEGMLDVAFDDFQQRLEAAMGASLSTLNEASSAGLAQVESAIRKMHEDLHDELDLQCAQAIASTEQSLRAQIPGMLTAILTPGLQVPLPPAADLKSEH
ncbi:MAG TPA: hypothetical protein VKV95_22210 [Terriglobia bacterium]|nr:hypothetical protein [Terriglobia bacterium]